MQAYLTKFVIARISGSFLYGLALEKKTKQVRTGIDIKQMSTN